MYLTLKTSASGDIRLSCSAYRKAMQDGAAQAAASLVCSGAFQDFPHYNPDSPPVGYGMVGGKSGLSLAQRSTVRDLGCILDREKLDELAFLTGTVPGGSQRALIAVAEWSGFFVSRLMQWLRDTCEGGRWVGVWEYQDRGALHMHLCVHCKNAREQTVLRAKWHKRWVKLLDLVVEKSGVDVYERADGGTWAGNKTQVMTDAQTVEKSVAHYLSKYLSKGASDVRRRCAYPPSCWYFADRALRAQARDERVVEVVECSSTQSAHDALQTARLLASEVAFKTRVMINRYDPTYAGLLILARTNTALKLIQDMRGVLAAVPRKVVSVNNPRVPTQLDRVCEVFGECVRWTDDIAA